MIAIYFQFDLQIQKITIKIPTRNSLWKLTNSFKNVNGKQKTETRKYNTRTKSENWYYLILKLTIKVIKTIWYWEKTNRSVEEESRNRPTQNIVNSSLTKEWKQFSGEMAVSLTSGIEQLDVHMQKKKKNEPRQKILQLAEKN